MKIILAILALTIPQSCRLVKARMLDPHNSLRHLPLAERGPAACHNTWDTCCRAVKLDEI